MDGVHDLGGMEGFGRLPLEENEPAFHYVWEARVMGMRLLMGGWRKWNIDAGRHSVELLPPKDYLSLTYYEKWLASLVNQSVKAGLITREEVARGRIAGDEVFIDAVRPQQAPFVVIAAQPEVRDALKALIPCDLIHGQVGMIVIDRLLLRIVVVEPAGGLGREQEVVVNERHGRSLRGTRWGSRQRAANSAKSMEGGPTPAPS